MGAEGGPELSDTGALGEGAVPLELVPLGVEVGEAVIEPVGKVVVAEVVLIAQRRDLLLSSAVADAGAARLWHQRAAFGTSAPTIRTSGASAGVWSLSSATICLARLSISSRRRRLWTSLAMFA